LEDEKSFMAAHRSFWAAPDGFPDALLAVCGGAQDAPEIEITYVSNYFKPQEFFHS
jgi:hypothetical protein